MDNRIFNVNGVTKEQLLATLKLALLNEYGEVKVASCTVDPDKGLVLDWHSDSPSKFPIKLKPDSICEIVWEWLQTDEARKTNLTGWDVNADHDGSNEWGFRVYCDDWGRVDGYGYSIVAIKPVYCWYGK